MRVALVIALGCIATACVKDVRLGDLPLDAAPRPDAGAPEAGEPEAGEPDANERDASDPDGGDPDGGDPDAAPGDAAPGDAAVGMYTFTLSGPYDTQCIDDLAGREVDFQILTPADCGLQEGTADLARTSSRAWTISGPSVLASFSVPSIRMSAGVFPKQPPEVLVSTLFLSGSGPFGTVRRSGAIGVDRTSLANHVDGFVGVELATPTDSGSCFLTFELALDR